MTLALKLDNIMSSYRTALQCESQTEKSPDFFFLLSSKETQDPKYLKETFLLSLVPTMHSSHIGKKCKRRSSLMSLPILEM